MKRQIRIHSNAIHSGSLILVNQDYPIYEEPKNEELAFLGQNKEISLRKEPATVLNQLIKKSDMEEEVILVSGYRAKEEQIRIYNESLKENGTVFTQKYVALPNHSEHQSGLAIDLAKNQKEIDFIRPEFPYSGKFAKFREMAINYGFVERYRQDKEDITNIAWEPWHFRYVGIPHATLMKENNQALEEYIEWIKQYDVNKNPFKYVTEKQTVRIGFVPVLKKEECCFSIADYTRFDISGNNVDGFVVTLYE